MGQGERMKPYDVGTCACGKTAYKTIDIQVSEIIQEKSRPTCTRSKIIDTHEFAVCDECENKFMIELRTRYPALT